MSRLAELLQSPEAFRAWLAAKGRREIIGRTCKSGECPLAAFIASTGATWVMVAPSTAGAEWPGLGIQREKLPPWADDFMVSVDTHGRRAGDWVTAADALDLLDHLTAGAGR